MLPVGFKTAASASALVNHLERGLQQGGINTVRRLAEASGVEPASTLEQRRAQDES